MVTEAGVVCGDVVCDFNAQCTEGACVCLSGFEGTGVAESGVPGCTGKFQLRKARPLLLIMVF